MMREVSVPEAESLAEGERAVHATDGVNLLLIREGGTLYAFENRCPHRGAPLIQAALQQGCLTCPWHGMQFDIATGACNTDDGLRLKTYPVHRHENGFFIECSTEDRSEAVSKGVRVALVRYGATGQIGWFGTIHQLPLHRGAQVVVETPLGAQLGEVLLGTQESQRQAPEKSELRGEITHLATAQDFEAQRKSVTAASLHFPNVQSRLEPLGHSAIELETTLDQNAMLVWLLSTPDALLGKLAVELAEVLSLNQVRFLQRRPTDAPVPVSSRYNELRSPRNARREGNAMKGPGLRQKSELDRLWECPNCRYHERTTGMQTSLVCPKCIRPEAGARTHFMKLIASPPTAPRRSFQVISNTPIPVPVVNILGEDTERIPKKQALRPALPEAAAMTNEGAAPPEVVEASPSTSLPAESPAQEIKPFTESSPGETAPTESSPNESPKAD